MAMFFLWLALSAVLKGEAMKVTPGPRQAFLLSTITPDVVAMFLMALSIGLVFAAFYAWTNDERPNSTRFGIAISFAAIAGATYTYFDRKEAALPLGRLVTAQAGHCGIVTDAWQRELQKIQPSAVRAYESQVAQDICRFAKLERAIGQDLGRYEFCPGVAADNKLECYKQVIASVNRTAPPTLEGERRYTLHAGARVLAAAKNEKGWSAMAMMDLAETHLHPWNPPPKWYMVPLDPKYPDVAPIRSFSLMYPRQASYAMLDAVSRILICAGDAAANEKPGSTEFLGARERFQTLLKSLEASKDLLGYTPERAKELAAQTETAALSLPIGLRNGMQQLFSWDPATPLQEVKIAFDTANPKLAALPIAQQLRVISYYLDGTAAFRLGDYVNAVAALDKLFAIFSEGYREAAAMQAAAKRADQDPLTTGRLPAKAGAKK
jgi:hypothetical protein